MPRRSPQYNRDTLNAIIDISEALKDDQAWLHSIGYSRFPAPHPIRTTRSQSDPTGEVAADQSHMVIRKRYGEVSRAIDKARSELMRASRLCELAENMADRSEDLRLLPRDHDLPVRKPTVSKAEHREAVRVQAKRKRAGHGYGES